MQAWRVPARAAAADDERAPPAALRRRRPARGPMNISREQRQHLEESRWKRLAAAQEAA